MALAKNLNGYMTTNGDFITQSSYKIQSVALNASSTGHMCNEGTFLHSQRSVGMYFSYSRRTGAVDGLQLLWVKCAPVREKL